MNILFIASFYEYEFGGAELVMRRLRAGLERRGHRVDVLSLGGAPHPQPDRIWRIPISGAARQNPQLLKRALIFLNNALFDRTLFRRALRLQLPISNYDWIHAHDLHCSVLAGRLANEAGRKLGLTIQENLPREFESGGLNRLLGALVQSALRRRDRALQPWLRKFAWITAPSRRICDRAREFLGPGSPPVFTVYSPYPEETALDIPPEARVSSPPKLLFMGRLSPEKGLDLLLESFGRFEQPCTLTILGLDGPLKQGVMQRAAADGRIQVRPRVSPREVPSILAQHDVVCCPSVWNDPLPGAVIEARLFRKAILATDRGGIPEILTGYAKASMVATEGKPRTQIIEDLRTALRRAVELTRVPPDPSAESDFLKRFSPERFIDQFERLYQLGSLSEFP